MTGHPNSEQGRRCYPFNREDAASDDQSDAAAIGATFGFAILTMLFCGAYASIYCRGLFQDGVYYLIRVCEHEWFYLYDPARTTVQIMRQAPVVLALNLGEFRLIELGRLLSLTMLITPPVLTALCWYIVPRDQKLWTLLPVISLLVGFSTTSFVPVGEASISASYFWILLFLLVFRTRTTLSRFAFLLLCLPAFQLHEAVCLLTPILLLALWSQRKEATSVRDWLFIGCAALLLSAILVYEARWVLYPRIVGEREAALHGILSLGVLYLEGHINLPAVTAILGIAALAVTFFLHAGLPEAVTRRANVIAAIFSAYGLLAIVAAWQFEETLSPAAQNLSRYNGIFASMALGFFIALFANARLRFSWSKAPTLVIVVSLAVTQMGTDLAATWRWRLYLHDFQTRLANSTGLTDWQGNAAGTNAARDASWRLMTIGWVNPIMSIVLSPDGQVHSILDYSPDATFRPFDPLDPNSLPRIRGVSYRSYFEAQKPRSHN
jgi:hypothetical protein